MRLFLVALLHLISAGCYAQIKSLSGSVTDSSGLPLSNVSVSVASKAETISAKTNNSGVYRFTNLPSSNFQLTISIIGFESYTKAYAFENTMNKPVVIDPVRLKINIRELPEVRLTPVNPVTVKEDTIEYRADAYRVREGAMVEDVLKKLPGVTVDRDGAVTAQGKEVTRVRLNGKDYFGGDVLTATRNLPANIIESIQVIDDYGEKGKLTGIKDGESEKVLNITIKKNRDNGSFGNATLVAGTKGRYLANVSANNLKGEKQVSLLGSLNNTNSSSFDFSGGARVGGGRSVAPGNSDRGATGISQQKSLGINYRNAWGKKLSAYGSYSYASRNNQTVGASYQQDINAQNISSIKSSNESKSNGSNQRLSWNLEYKMDSLNYVKFSPYFSSASSENIYKGNSEYNKAKYSTLNIGNAINGDAAPVWGTEIYYVHRFRKQRRNFNVSANLNHSTREQTRDVKNSYYNVDSTFAPPLSNYTEQNQLIGNNNVNTTTNLRFSFVEPMKKNSSLEFSYAWNNSISNSTREVNEIDQLTGEKVNNASQSNNYNFNFITNRIGFNFYRYEKKYNYSLGIAGQPTVLTGTDERRNITTRNSNFNFVPSARFVYKLPRNQSLTATYGGSSREPGFTQLQPVSDSSNLKTIIQGNPNLRPEFTNRFRLQYSKAAMVTGKTLFANISFDETQNKIVSSRVNDVNGTGRKLSYLNTNGFYGFNGNMSLSQPFLKKRFVLSFNTTGSFDNNISYTDNQKNTGHNWTFRPEVLLRIDLPDKLDVNIGGSYTYNKNTTRYTSYTYTSTVRTLNLGINGKNYFLKDWTFAYDLTRNMYMGYLKSFNANRTLLNLLVERRFLKNNKGMIRLQGFDLFDQNSGISRNINGTTITDFQNNRLSRYFSVSFNYRLQKFGGK